MNISLRISSNIARSGGAGYLVDAVATLIGRELRVRYKGSLLGLLWAVLSPLGTVMILHLLFTRIVPLDIPRYATFIYSGLLPWTWFQSAVITAAATLIDNRDLVRKPFFPRILLPTVVTGTNFLLYLLALPVLLILAPIEGVVPTAALLILPLVWIVQALFTLAVAVLIAALGVVVRDVQHLLGLGMLLWFYLTPLFYDLELVNAAQARWLWLNPLTTIVQAHRAIVLHGTFPDWSSLAILGVVSCLLLGGAVVFFRTLEDIFVEEV